MDSDINCTTTAIKDHDHAIFDHLCLKRGLAILAALNTGTLWLQTQKQVAWLLVFDDTCFLSCLAHEEFVFLTPKGWHS